MHPRPRTTLNGSPVQPALKRSELPRVYREKRPCAHPGCITRLNRYHEGDRCYAHESGKEREPTTAELMAQAPAPA